jgi:sulfinoalanine decarboxylase/sulfinoalanine decarboxylase/aspartate 1-decarboxylase
LKQIVDQQFELADIARAYIKSNPDYTLYSFDDSISVCFNYQGIAPMTLCTALYEHQITVVGFGSFNNDTFIRLITINTNNKEYDILNFFKVLEAYVRKTSKIKKEVLEQA